MKRLSEILHFSRLNIFHSSSCDALPEEISDSSDLVSLWPQPFIIKDHMIRQTVAYKLNLKEPSTEADRRSIFMGLYDECLKCKTR